MVVHVLLLSSAHLPRFPRDHDADYISPDSMTGSALSAFLDLPRFSR